MAQEQIKYKHKTKIGQPVFFVEIRIHAKGTSYTGSSYKEGIYITELNIVHQTEHKIVLSDPWVTVLDRQKEGRRKESYYHYLENASVSIKTKETYFPNGIFASGHTIDNPKKFINKLKSEIKRKVEYEFSFLYEMNLDSILDSLEIINSKF